MLNYRNLHKCNNTSVVVRSGDLQKVVGVDSFLKLVIGKGLYEYLRKTEKPL